MSDLIAPVHMARWDTGTLAWVVWDGSLTVGSVVIGAVTQSGVWTTNTKNALTASAPTTASVGVTSAQAVASNTNRKGLAIVNLSINTVSLGISAAAVLNNGISLTQNGVYVMDEYLFSTGAINAIAAGPSSTISIQEFT